MRTKEEKFIAQRMRNEGYSYKEIGEFLSVSWNVAKNLCTYKYKSIKCKRGPKFKVNKKQRLQIKRVISKMTSSGLKITAAKIKADCSLNASLRTVQYYLKKEGYFYKKAKNSIVLSKRHKETRVNIISEWINESYEWEKTIFSDEKRFSLDGPDNWSTYVPKGKSIFRNQRVCGGGGVMIWLMVLPNGLLSHAVINGTFGSKDYITLLSDHIVPIIKLNFGENCHFQQDNRPVHTAKKVTEFLKFAKVNTTKWPARSPDINIVEDIWHLLSNQVYDNTQFRNKTELIAKINEVIFDFNCNKRNMIQNLYSQIRPRLCRILAKSGNLYNK